MVQNSKLVGFFSLNTDSFSFYSLPTCIVSEEKWDVILIFVPLYVFLASFRIVSLCLIFYSLKIMSLGVVSMFIWLVFSSFLALWFGVKCEVLVAQSCPTLCDPMDCSLPGSSVHGIFQARMLPFPSPGDLSDSGIKPRSLSHISHRFFTVWTTVVWCLTLIWGKFSVIIILNNSFATFSLSGIPICVYSLFCSCLTVLK